MSKTSQLSFNGGEYTEFMDPRVDVAKFGKGCRTLENFTVLPFGAALARPGTVYGGEAKFNDRKCRLQPFTFSNEDTLDIEVGHLYFRFWRDRQLVQNGGTLEVLSQYQEEHLFELQFEQIQNVIYIVHPAYRPQKLTRRSATSWTLDTVDFSEDRNYPPLAPRNFDESETLALTGDFDTLGATVTVDAVGVQFASSAVGRLYTLTHRREETEIRQEIGSTGATQPIYVLGDFAIQTSGIGVYKVIFERSADRVTWETYRSYDIDGSQRNILNSESFSTPTYLRARITSFSSRDDDNRPHIIIESTEPEITGLLRVTTVVNSTQVEAEVVEPFHSGDASFMWREEFFTATRGYPRAVCVHRNRLCFGSTSVWLSQPGNYENFRTRNDVDSGFEIPIRRSGSPFVQWLEDLRELRVGTSQAEAVITLENQNEVFGYNNFYVRWDSNYGSSYLRPEAVNGTALFLQPEGRTLRYQLLTGVENYYDANTLTALADHILGNGVIQTAYQRQRYPTWHGIREDGQLASLLYEEAQNVQAFTRWTTRGEFESISVTPRPDEEDRIAFSVRREINGATKRFIEFVALDQYRVLQEERLNEMWFVDAGLNTKGIGLTSIDGLEHLEGQEVAILADGAKMANKTVTGGEVTLEYPADDVTVGLPYEMKLIPMFLEAQGIMGRSKNICAAIIRLWRAGSSLVRVDEGAWNRLAPAAEVEDSAPPLKTGDSEKLALGGDWGRNTTIEIRGSSPLPVNVQAITLEFEVGRH